MALSPCVLILKTIIYDIDQQRTHMQGSPNNDKLSNIKYTGNSNRYDKHTIVSSKQVVHD